MKEKWVMCVPVLSTGHLSSDTNNEEITIDFDGPGRSHCVPMDRGFMMYIGKVTKEEFDYWHSDLPDDLRIVAHWAINNEHEWIRFDADGDYYDELPRYEKGTTAQTSTLVLPEVTP